MFLISPLLNTESNQLSESQFMKNPNPFIHAMYHLESQPPKSHHPPSPLPSERLQAANFLKNFQSDTTLEVMVKTKHFLIRVLYSIHNHTCHGRLFRVLQCVKNTIDEQNVASISLLSIQFWINTNITSFSFCLHEKINLCGGIK